VLSFASDQSNAAMAQLMRLKDGISVLQDGYASLVHQIEPASTSSALL
jgi:hypothetical protein